MIDHVLTARRRDLGGFEVGRVLPAPAVKMIGPFIFFDHMGPTQFPANLARNTDVRPHPHIGLATITYLFDGEIVHRDSVGCHQVIRPGEVNWMTAGRGITHSERFETMREHGGLLDGIQAWVALPQADEEIEPSFVHFDAPDLPEREVDGTHIRLIAGKLLDLVSPVTVRSPLVYAHVTLQPGAALVVPAEYSERAAYVARGRIRAGGDEFAPGQMIVFARATTAAITALEATTLMLLGGEPVGDRLIWWNFVSSSTQRMEQAKSDWRAGVFKLPVDDDREFIPLPQEPPKPAPEPMS
ncbi:MAG: pirin family protein [Steroidobacteraceae bacterium]